MSNMHSKPAENIGVVLLAAGGSRRMGRPKQLLKFEGIPIVRHMAMLALELHSGPVVVVVGAAADRVVDVISDLSVEIVPNDLWEQGMGTSVAAGISALTDYAPPPVAALFMVVDQPHVSLLLLRNLIENYRRYQPAVVASAYNETLGVPAIFDQRLFPELASLDSDRGARDLIEKYRESLQRVPFPAGRFDLDTPEDYRRLLGD